MNEIEKVFEQAIKEGQSKKLVMEVKEEWYKADKVNENALKLLPHLQKTICLYFLIGYSASKVRTLTDLQEGENAKN